ncbi:hypothetical protein MVEN_00258400 [Mycena venus]|uniref:Uncharacterized protein n=1 Tax=Mycena venus TaxID=2733690 RepID=A0A8H6Z4U8_9AGAR|nr:hypothetical protein MVEN_00258400 [Mycena venus]
MSSDCLPFLPPELEREIFETAAQLYPETIPSLFLLARRVHEWIGQIKYRTVTSIGRRSSCSFRVLQQAIRSNSRPLSFFGNHVQHLCVIDVTAEEELLEVLSACVGIRNMTVIHRATGISVLHRFAVLRPRRLGIYLEPLLKATNICRPMFTFVTHLDVWDLPFEEGHHITSWPPLFTLFPALTHIAMSESGVLPLGSDALALLTQLEVIVVTSSEPLKDLPPVDDVRFMYIPLESMAYPEYEVDWIAGTQGGTDFWARADAFVAKKRRGEIEPSSRCWIEPNDGI